MTTVRLVLLLNLAFAWLVSAASTEADDHMTQINMLRLLGQLADSHIERAADARQGRRPENWVH